jgi:beta-lactamase class A
MATDWSGLAAAVQDAEAQCVVGVSVIGPDGERWSHNGARQFRAASTVKIPLMIEVFRGIERGDWSLDERERVGEHDKAHGSGVLLHLHDGLEVTLNDLLYLMISISDNTATNMLIRRVGMPAVNATMRELGMLGSNLGREMKGRPAQPDETENLATPDDYAAAVLAIMTDHAAAPASCAAMRALLERQQNARRIARWLAEDDAIRWGSKTGSITGVVNDVGFVSGPGGALVLAVFTEDVADPHAGEEVIGAIARAAWQATGVLGA